MNSKLSSETVLAPVAGFIIKTWPIPKLAATHGRSSRLTSPCNTRGWLALALICVFGASALAGCAVLRREAAGVILPIDQEIKLGKELSSEMEKELTLHPNQEVQQYISTLGRQVVEGAGKERHRSMPFTFKVVDEPDTINAFALPGGFIYIYSGLLLAAESEAEVVGVLAHEVAHVTRRHIAERLATAYGLQALTAVALGEDSSTLTQMVGTVLGTGYLLKFSREQEVDADVTAVRYAVAAGWNPSGLIDFFERLGGDREAGSRRALGWVSTHPMPEDRIVHVREAIKGHSSVPSRDGREDHQRLLALLGTADSTTATKSDTRPTDTRTSSPDGSPTRRPSPSTTTSEPGQTGTSTSTPTPTRRSR